MKNAKQPLIKLSITKFIGLLERHKYILVAIYCTNKNVRFVECRTPKYQKTFVVYLPPKYVLVVPSTSSLKRLNITLEESHPSSRQIRYMSDMKGPLLECDLLAISSEMICMYLNVGGIECFYIDNGDEDEDEGEDEEEDEDEEDEISTLEKDTVNLLQKIKPGAKLPKPKSRKSDLPKSDLPRSDLPKSDLPKSDRKDTVESEDEDVEDDGGIEDDEDVEDVEDIEDDGHVELIFEDKNGETYDEVKDILDTSAADMEDLNDLRQKIKKRDAEGSDNSDEEHTDDEDGGYSSRNNSRPPDLEEAEITLGIIYVLVDIRIFFKSIASYEEEVIK